MRGIGNKDSLKLTHGYSLASRFLRDALGGPVSSSPCRDSPRSVKNQHLQRLVAAPHTPKARFPWSLRGADANPQSGTTLCAKHVTHTSGKEDMITAGEGVQIKTLGFVEVFVSSVGPRGSFAGWCLVNLHSKDGLHISFTIRPQTVVSEEFRCRFPTDKRGRERESMECDSPSRNHSNANIYPDGWESNTFSSGLLLRGRTRTDLYSPLEVHAQFSEGRERRHSGRSDGTS